jgi:hypothetical protein
MPGCATRPPSRTSITASHAGSTVPARASAEDSGRRRGKREIAEHPGDTLRIDPEIGEQRALAGISIWAGRRDAAAFQLGART